MSRQYLSIAYREHDARTYTFHNDGEPVDPGDVVKLPSRTDPTAWVPGYVREVREDEPPFETKGIIGKKGDDE